MITGIALIAQERAEQVEKHGRTVITDARDNSSDQLSEAASILSAKEWGCSDVDDMVEEHCPNGWDKELWRKMLEKPHSQRLIIAGALIAAEIDRQTYVYV